MTEKIKRLCSMIDRYSQDLSIEDEVSNTPHEAPTGFSDDPKIARLRSMIDRYSQDLSISADVHTRPVGKIPLDSISATEENTTEETAEEELPIYEATLAEINYWHAWGCNEFLQILLREYNLDVSSHNLHAYNHFKIGMDNKRHMATFAIDDTHYYAIEFNRWNSAPVNKAQARKVLEKISAIRIATRRFENFCGIESERFD